ncbi:MAG: hypothetical protein QM747_14455 [Nocardioides sp.]
MSTTAVAPERSVDEGAPVIAGHPRGRGFGILSRLARTDDTAGRHVREDAAPEEHATVLSFERRATTPRHRRDDLVAGAMLNFG